MRTKIKICGITSPEETKYLPPEEVDFMGMILFCPKSKRNISLTEAAAIMKAVPEKIRKTAVTVSPSMEQVEAIEKAGFDYIQIHGTLNPRIFEGIHIPIIRAVNMKEGAPDMEEGGRVAAWLFDAAQPGSGKSFDWNRLSVLPRKGRKWILAGGLTAANVGEAIHKVHPDMVDVSSGVEYEDRKEKDPEKIAAFIRAVRQADEQQAQLRVCECMVALSNEP